MSATRPFATDPASAHPRDRERLLRAAGRFAGTEVLDPASTAFHEAYLALDGTFGARNELERRPVLERWLREPIADGRLRVAYHLLAWRDRETGALAAVRDAFVGVDLDRRLCTVLLSHSLVLPAFRRSGVAAAIRTSPVDLARRDLAELGLDPVQTPILLVAEMEPVVPSDTASVVRLLSYGRAGYGAIPPAVLPYCQPDFRDLAALGAAAEPLPMAWVVRLVGHEEEQRVPTALVDAAVDVLAALHLRACEPSHVRALAAAEHAALVGRSAIVELLVLPTRPAELVLLEPLLRSRALLHYPERFRTALPDPEDDLAALLEAARTLEAP